MTEFKQINEEVPGLTPDEALFPEAQAFRIGEHAVVVAVGDQEARRARRAVDGYVAELHQSRFLAQPQRLYE